MRLKTIIRNMFCLPGQWIALLAVPSFALVALALLWSWTGASAYLAYLLSAYALAVSLTWAFRSLKAAILHSVWLRRLLGLSSVRVWRADIRFRTRVSLSLSLAINLAYAVFKLVCGLRYHTPWFVILALYYALLAVLRYAVLRSARRHPHGMALLAEYRRYRLCGMILLSVNLLLPVMVAFLVTRQASYTYPGMLIYLMAAYTFYMFTLAVVNLIRFRRYGSPLLSAAKAINMTAALISMLSLEAAMLDRFGGNDPDLFRETMLGITGVAIYVAVLAISVFMLVRSNRAMKKSQITKLEQSKLVEGEALPQA